MQFLMSLTMHNVMIVYACLCNDIICTICIQQLNVFLPQPSPEGLSDRLQFGDPKAVGHGRGSER